jgi:hypothetical protein
MADLPYLVTNKRLPELFEQIHSAAVPTRFTFEFLKKLGFSSSNDRALPSLLKKLNFLDSTGVPTESYRMYRQKDQAKRVLADSVRDVYAELFAINEKIHEENRETVKGVVSRVTGAGETQVNLMTSTFLALAKLADFKALPQEPVLSQTREPEQKQKAKKDETPSPAAPQSAPIAFRHNVEIHLPATTNISVYNAIFKSLKEHLL